LALLATPAWAQEEAVQPVSEPSTAAEAAPASVASSGAAPAAPAMAPTAATKEEPDAFAQWWNGGDRILANTGFVSATFDQTRFNGQKLGARGFGSKGKGQISERSFGSESTFLSGVTLEMGGTGRYFGIMPLGLSFFWSNARWQIVDKGASPQDVTIYGGSLRVFQPRLRYALWRFEGSIQAGPVVHAAVVEPKSSSVLQERGFADLGLDLQAVVRAYPIDQFFIEAGYRHSFTLLDLLGDVNGLHDIMVGLGFAY
jgi:hypothetical protein